MSAPTKSNSKAKTTSKGRVTGGSGSMYGQGGVGEVKPGTSSPTRGGKSNFGVKGGPSGQMFGKQTVKPAKPA